MAKTLFTPENQAAVLEQIRKGSPVSHAAKRARLNVSTVNSWVRQGRASEDSQYHEFALEVDAALADIAKAALDKVVKESKKNWKAAAWLLERTSPEFSPRNKTEITGKDGGPIQQVVAPLTPEFAETMRRDMLGIGAPPEPKLPPAVDVEVVVRDSEKPKSKGRQHDKETPDSGNSGQK